MSSISSAMFAMASGLPVLLVPALLLGAQAAANEATVIERNATSAERAAQATTTGANAGGGSATGPWPAPVGHRQPRAADIPRDQAKTESDRWLERINRETNAKLRICRGC